MMTTGLITSGQKNRIAQLIADATLEVLENFGTPIENESAQLLIKSGGDFQKHLMPHIVTAIRHFCGAKHSAPPLLEKYFQEVYGYTLDLTGVVFPEKDGFGAWMAVPPKLDEDVIMKRLTAYFRVNTYSWKSPIAANINREMEQKRPQGLYVFAHRGGDESDDVHRNKSYDDGMSQGLTFLNPKEYILASGFHRYTKGHFMDRKVWTRTSSLWSDGYLVYGYWLGADEELCLSHGHRDNRHPDYGLREAVFA